MIGDDKNLNESLIHKGGGIGKGDTKYIKKDNKNDEFGFSD